MELVFFIGTPLSADTNIVAPPPTSKQENWLVTVLTDWKWELLVADARSADDEDRFARCANFLESLVVPYNIPLYALIDKESQLGASSSLTSVSFCVEKCCSIPRIIGRLATQPNITIKPNTHERVITQTSYKPIGEIKLRSWYIGATGQCTQLLSPPIKFRTGSKTIYVCELYVI